MKRMGDWFLDSKLIDKVGEYIESCFYCQAGNPNGPDVHISDPDDEPNQLIEKVLT